MRYTSRFNDEGHVFGLTISGWVNVRFNTLRQSPFLEVAASLGHLTLISTLFLELGSGSEISDREKGEETTANLCAIHVG